MMAELLRPTRPSIEGRHQHLVVELPGQPLLVDGDRLRLLQVLATVFHPFIQESHATRFNGTGLGIGLTVVRELAEAHGGTVEVSSAGEGKGCEFVLTLPRHADVTDISDINQ